MSIATGTRLGQYEVQDFIGQGAMGVVYRAYHSALERTGAVKVMQGIAPDANAVARFRHEAQAIAKLRHPNIVDVYDFGEFHGTPYMIVEYVPGGSLAGRMAEGALDRRTALGYLRGIAAGLDYAHGRGIVHRDVKPANVLLTADDTPVLADFGLAKLMQGSSLKSMTGVTTGTPAYMAPEQVTGNRVGPAADRYSLATIAYEMLTGVIPFDGEGLIELLYAQVHREPPPPSSRDESLGPRVDAVIMRGLAKEPAARWDSASAFVDALAAALSPERAMAATMVMTPAARPPVQVAETAVMERVEAPAQQVLTLAYPSPPPRPLQRRKSRKGTLALVALGVIAVLLFVAVSGWVATHRPVTFALSATTVTAGDAVAVSADHLPANQAGRVELWSPQYTYPFRASANGRVDLTFTVPVDIGAGDHLVKLCWGGSCRLQQTLHVLERTSSVSSPTPSSSPSRTASPSPSPPASPTAATTPGRTLLLSSGTIHEGSGSMTVKGIRFAPNKIISLRFVQEPTRTDTEVNKGVVDPSGDFLLNYKIPITARAGIAYLVACDPVGCAYASVTVTSG